MRRKDGLNQKQRQLVDMGAGAGGLSAPLCQEGREAGPASFYSPGEGRARLPWKPDHGRSLAYIRLIGGSSELIGKEPGCVFFPA